jgi:D-alanine-D-alanine ligase
MSGPVIAVFAGGTSAEREVSLGSGRACALALARSFPTQFFSVEEDALPPGLDPARHVVFSTLHGTFGEDGGMQRLLDSAGIRYAGSAAAASALAMDKTLAKAAAAGRGVRAIEGVLFHGEDAPAPETLLARLGEEIVIKPNAEGSSVGLSLISGRTELAASLSSLPPGSWLAERRIRGRELSVGVLGGRAMAVVEIRPRSGVYDYASKYTKGLTEYFAPAPLPPAVTAAVRGAAEAAFAACGCRDYARADFILSEGDEAFFLEINTLPGMKETSLLPMSARGVGLDFIALVREMVSPAIARLPSAVAAARP